MTAGDGNGPVVILAGSGRLPLILAETLRRHDRPCRILAFRGFAEGALRRRADAVVDLLDVRASLEWLRRWGPAAVALAGTVDRPKPSALLSAFSIVRNRQFLKDLMARGDDGLLRGAVDLIEEQGHRVVGVQEIAPELLAPSGVLGRRRPSPEDEAAVATGFALLSDVAAYDVGQAAVVAGGRVLALEGPEGTDRMLARVRRFRRPWSAVNALPGGVLVKTAKAGQDLRVDLPAIGPRTVREAARAGVRGIAIGAGSTLVIDREETIAAADGAGLFILGVEPPSATATS